MGVGSYFELYTTAYGWTVYNIIWDALAQTTIIYIPFMVIVFSTMIGIAREIGGFGTFQDDGVQRLFATALLNIFIGLVVLLLAVAPTVDLSVNSLTYKPRPTFDEPTPATVTTQSDPTVYQNTLALNLATDVKLPLAWNLISRVASGITFGVAYSLPRPEDLEEAMAAISVDKVTDSSTAAQITAFRQACYLPARSKLVGWMQRSNTLSPTLTGLLTTHGVNDITWMGSPILLMTPGLYRPCDDPDSCQDTLQARAPVEGWPFQADRDAGWYSQEDTLANTPGRPNCDEWWYSLKFKLLDEVKAVNVWQKLTDRIRAIGPNLTVQDVQTLKVQKLLRNSEIAKEQMLSAEVGAQFNEIDNGYEAAGVAGAAWRWGGRIASPVGKAVGVTKLAEYGFTGINAYTQSRKMSYYKKAMPAIIGIMLMVIPIVLPFVMLWKGYTIEAVVTTGIVYFAIRFLSALFEIGVWIERGLIEATLSSPTAIASYVISGGVEAIEGALALSFVLVAVFMVIPFLFLYIAASFGLAFGNYVAGAQNNALSNIKSNSGTSVVQGGVTRMFSG